MSGADIAGDEENPFAARSDQKKQHRGQDPARSLKGLSAKLCGEHREEEPHCRVPPRRPRQRTNFWYDEHDGLVVYDANATVIYEDTLEEDPLISNSQKENKLYAKLNMGTYVSTQERRRQKRDSALAPAELTELKQIGAEKLQTFPSYTPKFVLTVPKKTESTLLFSSRFESGNLHRASRLPSGEYNLLLRPDCPAQSCSQWFYFAVYNVKKGIPPTLSV